MVRVRKKEGESNYMWFQEAKWFHHAYMSVVLWSCRRTNLKNFTPSALSAEQLVTKHGSFGGKYVLIICIT